MTNDEAKFLLRGYRPNGSDAGDPELAEALAQAEHDPALRDWFEREQQFDSVVAAGLSRVQPPAGLRESILAGTRLGTRTAKPAALPWWIGVAAALTLSIGTIAYFGFGGESAARTTTLASLVDVAWSDMDGHHPSTKHADAYPGVGEWLENPTTRLHDGSPLDLATLTGKGCRTGKIAGSFFVEICFRRNGTLFHVYMAPRKDFKDPGLDSEPMFHQKGELVTASWADDKFVYVVASTHGADGLRAIL